MLRPYGVSLLIGGVDNGPALFATDLSGTLFKYKANAIGNAAKGAQTMLQDILAIRGWCKKGFSHFETSYGRDNYEAKRLSSCCFYLRKGIYKVEAKWS